MEVNPSQLWKSKLSSVRRINIESCNINSYMSNLMITVMLKISYLFYSSMSNSYIVSHAQDAVIILVVKNKVISEIFSWTNVSSEEFSTSSNKILKFS